VNGPRELPVYLPSPSGHLSAVLALPAAGEGPPDVGVVLLSGSHIPRSNKNGMWTRAARDLAALGAATLRMDEDGAGESEGVPDRWPISRISPAIPAAGVRFLVEEVGASRVLISATCYGARLAIAGAAEETAVEGVLFAAAPVMGHGGHRWPVRQARRVMRKVGLHASGAPSISPKFLDPFLSFLPRGRVHFLYGDRDPFLQEIRELLERLEEEIRPHREHLSLEVIPGHELHAFKSQDAQELAIAATIRWARPFLQSDQEPARARAD
jgi:dienelactone hydrolase